MKDFIPTVIMGAIAIGIAVWTYYTKKNDDNLDNKVNKEDCISFKTRIGKESENHSKNIIKIQKSLIFLVRENGGNPVELGLLD